VGLILDTALGNLKRHIEGSKPSTNAFQLAPGISSQGGREAAQSPAEEVRDTSHQEVRGKRHRQVWRPTGVYALGLGFGFKL
jgi:hypothetical protein